MAPTVFFFLLYLVLNPTRASIQLNEEGFISVAISEKGLDYAKDLLIQNAISSIVKLQLPQIENSVRVRFVGNCRIVVSNITVTDVRVNSSYVKTGRSGIVLVASGGTANLSMGWSYSCSTWLLPIAVSDSGGAYVKFKGMQVGLTVDLKNQEGNLKLDLLDYGFYAGDLTIKVDSVESWLYQRVVDVFAGKIASVVENGISEKIREGISKLNKSLQSLPKQISLDKTAVLNISLVENPVLTNSSIEFDINGLFTGRNEVLVPQGYHRESEITFSCGSSSKMIKISLHENVLKSASLVYFNAGYMQWVVSELPDQALLNTAGWRFIVPQLYKQYPNDDIKFNISVSSPPILEVTDQDIGAIVVVDFTIDVLHAGDVISVACISMEIRASCSAEIFRNNIAGSLRLNNFSTYLKWSKIGHLHMHLIKLVMSTLLRTSLSFMNLLLSRGFPLPDIHGVTFQNSHISYNAPWVTVCSDISLVKYNLSELPTYVL